MIKEIVITIIGQFVGIFTDSMCLGCLKWIKHVKVQGYHRSIYYYRICPKCKTRDCYLTYPRGAKLD